ncbi:formin-F-like [Centruroides vittatus]|uniref:formin-F-like n=1 Tax=Centruroides vittatus TaxID=120091 RepID=UPI00351031D4
MLPEDEDRKRHLQGYLVGKVYPHKNLNSSDYIYLLRHHLRSDNNQDATDRSTTKNIPEICEILQRLKEDLRSSKSFIDEFINETNRGVKWLLDLLRLCPEKRDKTHTSRDKQYSLKRSLTEEYDCLLCLKLISGSSKAIEEMTEHNDGLSTIANCIMSNYSKSRLVALELLTKCCNTSSRGYNKVLEAMSQVRVIYGESVRFKFLVAILNGNVTTPPGFERITLSFLNTLLKKCPKLSEKIRLQCELEEAGLDMKAIEIKMHAKNVASDDEIWSEIKKWKENCIDVENDMGERRHLSMENVKLQQEIILLRKALKKLEDDKICLMQIERELKERCDDLDQEVTILRKELQDTKSALSVVKENASVSSEVVTDSGRHSSITDDYFMAEENNQAENEEILIDIPTIRPPIGFRSATDDYVSDKDDKKPKNGSRRDDDSALSESDSDSAITWQYPALVPETRSRSADRSSKSGSHRTPRSRSENRSKVKGITSVEDTYSSGFFFRPASSHTSGHVSNESFASLPPDLLSDVKERQGRSPKSFPLPVSYRNHFVLRGHSNCGKYSGSENKIDIKIPTPDYADVQSPDDGVSALVHREITEAVRQIGGWL